MSVNEGVDCARQECDGCVDDGRGGTVVGVIG